MTTIIILPLWRRKVEKTRQETLARLPALGLISLAHELRMAADPRPEARMLRLALAAELRARSRDPVEPEVVHIRKEIPCP